MKKIIALLAISASLAACNTEVINPEQTSIESVYSVDSKVIGTSKTAGEVVAKLQTMLLTGCPADFVDAFKNNVKAWERLVILEKKMYPVNMQKATKDIEKFISSYDSDAPAAVVALKKEWPDFAKEIDTVTAEIARTKAVYTSIGAKYNAVYKKDSIF